jgi:hypothetical protein
LRDEIENGSPEPTRMWDAGERRLRKYSERAARGKTPEQGSGHATGNPLKSDGMSRSRQRF